MSGHSKWHSIKHKKAAVDAKRGKIFTKIIKELTVAARLGGGDAGANPRLRTAVDKAKSVNMPNDTIERAIKKGTGELEGVSYEEMTYEGYAPGGVAIIAEVMTDNRNRTVGELRYLFSKYGGNLAETNAVAWMFSRRGIILVAGEGVDEDELMMAALEAGAEDVSLEEDLYEVVTEIGSHTAVRSALEENGYNVESSELTLIPQNTLKLEGKELSRAIKLINLIDDHDDVQNCYHNLDAPAETFHEA